MESSVVSKWPYIFLQNWGILSWPRSGGHVCLHMEPKARLVAFSNVAWKLWKQLISLRPFVHRFFLVRNTEPHGSWAFFRSPTYIYEGDAGRKRRGSFLCHGFCELESLKESRIIPCIKAPWKYKRALKCRAGRKMESPKIGIQQQLFSTCFLKWTTRCMWSMTRSMFTIETFYIGSWIHKWSGWIYCRCTVGHLYIGECARWCWWSTFGKHLNLGRLKSLVFPIDCTRCMSWLAIKSVQKQKQWKNDKHVSNEIRRLKLGTWKTLWAIGILFWPWDWAEVTM